MLAWIEDVSSRYWGGVCREREVCGNIDMDGVLSSVKSTVFSKIGTSNKEAMSS